MKNGVKADERDQILHIILNLSMVLEGKVKSNAKQNVDPHETAAWLIERLEQAAQDLKTLLNKEHE